jgi:hypothetical protein
MKHSHLPLLIAAVAVTIFVGALYWYMFNTMSVSVVRAGAARDVVATEQHDQAQAKTLATTVSTTMSDRGRLPDLFISSDDIVSFITSIESLGPQTNTKVVLTSIDADQTASAAAGSVAHAKAHVEASGSWPGVMRLLGLVERLPYASNINHVRFDAGQADAKTGVTWSASFDIQALVLVTGTASSTSH